MTLTLEIQSKSPTILGSGEGFGALIDTDIVYDTHGIPYLPGKRLKGILRDAARDVNSMLAHFEETAPVDLDMLFGSEGTPDSQAIRLSNLYVSDYENVQQWIRWMSQQFPGIINQQTVLDYFTETRTQTSIDPDTETASSGSLRIHRTLRAGLVFQGEISSPELTARQKQFLAASCAEVRFIGMSRTRGFGEVKCSLLENGMKLIGAELFTSLKERTK